VAEVHTGLQQVFHRDRTQSSFFSPAAVVAMRGVDPAMSGAASGLFNLSRLTGGTLGSAAVAAVLQTRLGPATARTGFTAATPSLAGALQAAYVLPFLLLVVGALIVAVGVRRPRP